MKRDRTHTPDSRAALSGERGGEIGSDTATACAARGRVLLLVASGASALVFQVLWITQLGLIVGVDVQAVTIAVSAFFAGLALGGLWFGRRADRSTRPLRLYAALEVGVAAAGVVTTLALAHTAPLFAALEARSAGLAWALVFAIVAVAPFLMGGTLPAIVRSLRPGNDDRASAGGRMYAANTAGAILGALGAAFFLIPKFGIQGTALVAAALSAVAAVCAFLLDLSLQGATVIDPQPLPVQRSSSARLAILVYSVAGGLALGYEVVWSQSLVQFMSTRTFAFSVMLATYLSGLAMGAALFARRAGRVKDPWSTLGLLLAAAGLAAMLELAFLGRWLSELQTLGEHRVLALTSNELAGMCARFAIAALYVVFVPTVLLGAAFPAALRLIVEDRHVGRDLGRVIAWNTLGGIGGTLLTGFVLVPRFGLVRTLALLAGGAALLGLFAVSRGSPARRGIRWSAIAFVLAVVGAAAFTPGDRFARLLADARGGELIFYEEGRGGTVAVIEQGSARRSFRRLYIQGVSNTGDAMPSLRYMRLQALLPLLVHGGEPRSALVVGLGTGITAGALLAYPELEERVVAEILPEVVVAAPNFRGNLDAARDPRIDLRLRDGRRELLRDPALYDVITLEPPPPSAAGVVNLYSSDFYRLARARLRPNGVFAQWLPIATQNDEDTRSLVRSFLDVFPQASLWSTELHEMLLVGAVAPLELDGPRIAERYHQPAVESALREVGIASPEALLATWITDRAGLELYAGDAPAVTDDQPRIEYADWVRDGELQRVLPRLLELRTAPPVRKASAAFSAAVEAQRAILHTFYRASLHALAGEREAWAQDLQRVTELDGGNAYYRWFTSGGP
ncbi:MAG: spermidine synthase [Planctomycetes bacterium]|nr:spermidine synthase [Planctomycetota bacterium]